LAPDAPLAGAFLLAVIYMKRLEEETLEFIRKWNLLKRGQRILVAVSGGKDSMALLNILTNIRAVLSIDLAAANLDHCLRKKGPAEEAAMIRVFCDRHGIPFYHERRDVREFMLENGGMSIEEAAREVRYDYLRKVKRETGSDAIAVAHNRDDLAETMLLRLVRGTGIKGIVGLRPSNGDVVRPLLFCDMQQIMDYVTINMVTFMDDETNFDAGFERNYMRMKIVPELKKLNPSFNLSMWRFFENALDDYRFIEREVQRVLEDFDKLEGVLFVELESFGKLDKALIFESVREVVAEMSGDGYPPSRERIESFYEHLNKRGSWVIEFREDVKVTRVGKFLFFFREKLEFKKVRTEIIEELPFSICEEDWCLRLERGRNDSKNLDGRMKSICNPSVLRFPLKLRPLNREDQFTPFGLGKPKPVREVVGNKGLKGFISAISVLVNCDGEILWVPGVASSEMCRVGPSVKDVAVFSLERR
jgi:tRNA(Ile)-lysidine synthase